MRGIDGWLSLIMKERCTHWKDFVERLMNEENVLGALRGGRYGRRSSGLCKWR